MRNRDEEFLTMSDVTLKALNKYNDVWQDREAVSEIVEIIDEAVKDIEKSQQGDGATVSTGFTKDKETAVDDAIDEAVELAGYAQVYARRINSQSLLDQMKQVTRRRLEKIEDTALVNALEDVHTRLTDLGDAVEKYGITTSRLNVFKTIISTYDSLKDTPRNVIVTRKGERTTQSKLLSQIRSEWRNLDLLIAGFRNTHAKFVADYQNARIIVNRGGGHKGGEENGGAGQ